MSGINKKVEGSKTRSHETSPPPIVVFSCQMEVAKKDGSFRASDDQNNGNEKEEAKHVIDLVRPKRVEDEKQLNENATEWQYSAHNNAGNRSGVKDLFGNMSRNWICSNWMLNRPLFVSIISSKKTHWRRNSNPKEHYRQNSREWNSRRRSFAPKNQIHNEENSEYNTRDEESCHKNIRFPFLTTEGLVNTR